jgi:hypothetical protein
MVQNVAWNTSGLKVSGDVHNVTCNTAFDGSDTTPSDPFHDRPRYQDHHSSLDSLTRPSITIGTSSGSSGSVQHYDPHANSHSTFSRNVFDMVRISAQCPQAPNCTAPGHWTDNIVGIDVNATAHPFDIRAELRDPYHLDFRPCPNSSIARLGAGAYPPLSEGSGDHYWIPGRRDRAVASSPVPPSMSIGVHRNLELMFLPSHHAIAHKVYFGKAADGHTLPFAKLLTGEANIVRLPGLLEPDTAYAWRVDSQSTGEALARGETWVLRTGSTIACAVIPHPPAPPMPPGPARCTAVEQALCPGDAHGGAKVCDPCYQCVVNHSNAFSSAGCWGESTSRHSFIEAFCS